MTEISNEQYAFSNKFGEVSDRRLVYFWKKNWFSGKRRIDIPMKQVVSVTDDVERNFFGGVFFTVVGTILLMNNIIGIIPLAVGILIIWGAPTVIIRNAGGEKMGSVGYPWEKGAAEEFANAVRTQLFKD